MKCANICNNNWQYALPAYYNMHYYRLLIKIIKGLKVRINGFLVKQLIGINKPAPVNTDDLQYIYSDVALRKQRFLVSDAKNKLLLQHIIPATYKNVYQHLSFFNVLHALLFRPKKTLAVLNKVFIWGNAWSTGYYHFVAEDLCKLVYMQGENIDAYTWQTGCPRWKEELLGLFGLTNTIITRPVWVRQAVYITNSRVYSQQHKRNVLHPMLVSALQNRLATLVQGWQLQPAMAKKIIWISRRFTQDRHIINEDECIGQLRQAGITVEVLYPEKKTVKQQIATVYNAWCIIGPHGAGLTNILFSANACLIEVGPGQRINNSFISLAASLNRQYAYIKATPVSKLFKNRSNLVVSPASDFVQQVQQAVKQSTIAI